MASRQSVEWSRIDAALDELINLPADRRIGAIDRLAGGDATLAQELRSLVGQLDGQDELLDHPAVSAFAGSASGSDNDGNAAAAPPSLPPGTRLGPWRVLGLIGRGGMGEVFRAERADGQFQQQVAIKLTRADGLAEPQRFRQERRIVARLEHPGIARLIDGDVSADGRPYMVMEYVDGLQIIDWCAAHAATLERRLALFADVCGAVAYAHRNLIVHRDLKPDNVLVTPEGRSKLLDFGVARLLDTPAGDATRTMLLTPGYAAPEQLGGAPITTAADVHALGLLLHELLCGRPAFDVSHLPLAAAMQQVATQMPLSPSRAARALAAAPVAAQRLAGDLDAIVAKALRKEPELRYGSVDELLDEVQRFQRHEPVRARRGGFSYVAGRALRRHAAWAVAGSVALLVLLGGTGAVAWQARVAREEAARATAAKNFLLRVFKASDPRISADKPRGEATARELLDAGSARVERDFAGQPDLLVELLGTLVAIYRELGETERYRGLQARRVALAERDPGRFAPALTEEQLNQAADQLQVPNRALARQKLDAADALLRRAGLDDSLLRANWWLLRGQSEEPEHTERRQADFDAALRLFDRFGPRDAGRVSTIGEMALTCAYRLDRECEVRYYRQALAAEADTDEPNDGEAQAIWGNLGTAYHMLGRYDEALDALGRAAEIAHKTYGEKHRFYWAPAAEHARLLHLLGRRDEALRRFEALVKLVPDPPTDADGWRVRVAYAERLAAQGEPALALKWLEQDERFEVEHRSMPHTHRRLTLLLGDAYDRLGRDDDARRMLERAYNDYLAHEAPTQQSRMAAAERWARFLVEHGQAADAAPIFAQVLDDDQGRGFSHTALAQAGLARVALARNDLPGALQASALAVQRWAAVRGFRDVRMGATIGRVRARVLLAGGDPEAARPVAEAALAESQRDDAATAASIIEARELLEQARSMPAARH